MAGKHLILDVSALLTLWLGRPGASDVETLVDEIPLCDAKLWVAATSLPTLEYLTGVELKRLGMPPEQAATTVRALMGDLFSRAGVLSSHGFEQPEVYAAARDFEDAQIAASARSLTGGDVRLVTLDSGFDTLGEIHALNPVDALAWLRAPESQDGNMPFVDLAAQQSDVRSDLERHIEQVLRHGKYILGPEVGELEQKLAEYVGVKHCVGVSSGTDSLLIALMALGVRPGDEVITTPFSFIATAEVIALLGAKPVFVDIDPRTFNLDPALIEPAVTPKTKAIMPVSLYGQCADFDAINAIAAKHDLPVVEDGAQSFGATYKGRRSCGLCTIGATSFFPSKPLGGYGDGGALFTNDDGLAKCMREIRAHGQDKRYHHARLGLNGRLDTLQAAVLLAKFERFPWEVKQRAAVGARYTSLIDRMTSEDDKLEKASVVAPYIEPHNTSVLAQYTVRVTDRPEVQSALKEAGIPTAVHYPVSLHFQPAFGHFGYAPEDFPMAEEAASEVFSLPMHPYLTRQNQDSVVAALAKAVAKAARE